jgi:uncharacterized membrane protein
MKVGSFVTYECNEGYEETFSSGKTTGIMSMAVWEQPHRHIVTESGRA